MTLRELRRAAGLEIERFAVVMGLDATEVRQVEGGLHPSSEAMRAVLSQLECPDAVKNWLRLLPSAV